MPQEELDSPPTEETSEPEETTGLDFDEETGDTTEPETTEPETTKPETTEDTPDFETRLKEETTRLQTNFEERLKEREDAIEELKAQVREQEKEAKSDRIIPEEWDQDDETGKRHGPDTWEDFARKVRDATITEMENRQSEKEAEVRKQNEVYAKQLKTLRDNGAELSREDVTKVFTFMADNSITSLEKGYQLWKQTSDLEMTRQAREKKRQEEASKVKGGKGKFRTTDKEKVYRPGRSLDEVMMDVIEEMD